MSEPQTLLSLAGIEPHIPQLSESVLIIIDAQNEYMDGPVQIPSERKTTAKIRELLDIARASDGRVIHIVHRGSPGGPFDLSDHRGKIIQELRPFPGEQTIEKTKPNAFAGTELANSLGKAGQPICVAGYMTHMCVSSTVRAASDLGYPVTVVADGCATRDLPKVGGGIITAADLHDTEVAALADRFASVKTADEILSAQQ